MRRTLLALVALAPCLLAGTARAETLYVRTPTATLKAEASASAGDLSELTRGTEVEVMGRDGSWVRVQAGGAAGWLHKLKLSEDEPEGESILAFGGGERGRFEDEATSQRGARGLSPVAEDYAKNKAISPKSIAAVKRMEEFDVSDAEVDRFLREGKLGEWAE